MPSGLALNSPMRSLSRANEAYAKMAVRLKNVQAKGEEMTDKVVATAEVAMAAGALGFIRGKYGPVEILGVPLELALGIGLNLAAHAKLAGSSSEHLHHFGNGALALYTATVMTGVGRQTGTPAAVIPAP